MKLTSAARQASLKKHLNTTIASGILGVHWPGSSGCNKGGAIFFVKDLG